MPDLIQKQVQFEVKSVNEDGTFEGYASVTGVRDLDGEVVDKGAFKRTLDHSKGIVPILWQHIKQEPIGWNTFAAEDEYGLKVKGKLDIEHNGNAKKAYGFLKMGLAIGATPGLSIGFMVPKDGSYQKDGERHYKEVIWKEYSVVTFPANEDATATGVKEDKDKKTTKLIDGVAHGPEDFAYVGDPEKVGTWHFPIFDEKHTRLAVDLWSTSKHVPASAKPKTLAKIRAAAKRFGIEISDDKKEAMADELIEKDAADGDGNSAEPMSFDDAMASRQAQQNLEDDRWNIERAKGDSIDSIKGSSKAKGDKKILIHKTLHDYANAMTDWHGKAMDMCDQYGKENGEHTQIKGMSTPAHLALQKKLASAKVDLAEAKAHSADAEVSAKAAADRHTKGLGKLQEVWQGYSRNDVQLPNPMPKENSQVDEQKNEKTGSDPEDVHSLKSGLDSLLDLFKAA